MENYTYLLLMAGSILFPVIFSFEKQIHFVRKWKYMFTASVLPAAFFIVWDILFTQDGVWSFNDNYTLGFRIAGLPIEEWSFFFVVPFCSVFIYEVIKFYLPKFDFPKTVNYFHLVLFLFSSTILLIFKDEAYTFYNFLFTAGMIIISYIFLYFKAHRTHFTLAWIVGIVPMMIVNGILTSFPVVSYHPMENSGIRIFTIPFEDFFYYYVLLIMNILIYEAIQKKSNQI